MKKKRYNITLTQPATEKVHKVLCKANLTLSAFLDVMVCTFSDLIDEQGISEKMDDLTMSGVFDILSNMFGKVEEMKDAEMEEKIESMKMKPKPGRPRKNVAEKET